MIVIDTSALVAILNHEPERTAFFQAIIAVDRCLVSAVTYQEAGHVLFARHGVNGLAITHHHFRRADRGRGA